MTVRTQPDEFTGMDDLKLQGHVVSSQWSVVSGR
jgi:hypothetical protein